MQAGYWLSSGNIIMRTNSASLNGIHRIKPEKSSLAAKVSRAVFVLYVAFLVVGGSPFHDKITDVEDIGYVSTSTPLTQVVNSVVPLVALLCLLPKRKRLLLLLKEEKYLTLFWAWCSFSILWSDFTLDSVKLWLRLFGSMIVILALLLNLKSPDEALKYFKLVFALYIAGSFLSVAFDPSAIQ